LSSVLPAWASGPPLQKETFSAEATLYVGADAGPRRAQGLSREVALFVGADAGPARAEALSRETCLMVSTPQVPARVTPLAVGLTATGDAITLDWSGYDELCQRDVVRYAIYVSDRPFTSVAGMPPEASVPAGTFVTTLGGFTPWRDRYVAVVAVDARGGFDPTVFYSGAYCLAPEAVSSEVTLFVGADAGPGRAQALSREACVMVATPAPPACVACLTVAVAPRGDAVRLDWSGYDELLQRDVVRYDVYVADRPFTSVAGRTPCASVPAGSFSAALDTLAAWQDRYLAVVPVDVLGGLDPVVCYAGAYVFSPETFGREAVLFVGAEPPAGVREAGSREAALLVTDRTTPAPVTCPGSPVAGGPSAAEYRAVDLNWSQYDELAQHDVVRYRIYVGPVFFDNVGGMQPYAYVDGGTQTCTLRGLQGNAVYAVAVVAEDALGLWNPNVQAVYVMSSAAEVFRVALKAWLQGPFAAADGRMGTALQPALPRVAPYGADALRVSSVDTNVTDWFLGELRDTNGQPVVAHSLWLRPDGRVTSPGHTQTLWAVSSGAELYLVLKHRNHLAAMSAKPLIFTNILTSYDFTTGPDKYYGGTNACVQLASNVWGMIAGDADGDGKITPVDRKIVEQQRGKTGYLSGDLNLDGKVDGGD
jgi:hypothetical protein